MPLSIECPRCGKQYRLPSDTAGRVVLCQACHQQFRVADQVGTPPAYEESNSNAGRVIVLAFGWVTLALAVFLSVWAAVFPLVGLAGTVASFALAGISIAVGIGALIVSLLLQRRMIGACVLTIFLGVVGLLFSWNSAMAPRVLAQSFEARQEREEAKRAQKTAAETLEKAEDVRAKAELEMTSAKELRATATKLLEQAKFEQSKTNKARLALAEEQNRLETTKIELNEKGWHLENSQRITTELAKKAEVDAGNATRLWQKAEQERRRAEELFAKAKDAVDSIRAKLKATQATIRRAAIKAIAQICESSCTYDVCELAVGDTEPEVRREAIAAIKELQPGLYEPLLTLTSPPQNSMPAGYVNALKQLAVHGNGGLPLIRNHLQKPEPAFSKMYVPDLQKVLTAEADTLAKMSGTSDAALELLMSLPESPLEQLRVRKITYNDDLTWHDKFSKGVAVSLVDVTNGRPVARTAVLAYFIEKLKSSETRSKLWGTVALAEFGSDAISALPALKRLEHDGSDAVQRAAKRAISKIQ